MSQMNLRSNPIGAFFEPMLEGINHSVMALVTSVMLFADIRHYLLRRP
jgi:hypothetical protein